MPADESRDADRWDPGAGRHDAQAPLRNRRFLLALLLILGAISVWIAWPLVAAIVFAVVIGYVLHPAYAWLLARVKRAWIAGGLMLLAVGVALTAPLAYLAWRFVAQAGAIRESLGLGDGYRTQAIELVARFGVDRATAEAWIARATSLAADAVGAVVVETLRMLPALIIGLVVFFILLYFVFVHGDRMVRWFHEYAPLARDRREMLLAQTGQRVRAILLGTFFVSALQGVTAGIGWWIFGFPAPVFWGFVMTVFAILPFLGAQMITIPAGILAILRGDMVSGIGIIVYTLIAVSLIDDLVRPWVIGKQAGVHPGLILVGTLGGLQAMGLAGLILGPLVLGLIEPVLRTWRDASGPPPNGHPPLGAADEDDEEPAARGPSRRVPRAE